MPAAAVAALPRAGRRGCRRALAGAVTRLGTHFEQAQEDVRQIRISTEKVVRRGERTEAAELGAEGPDEPPLGEPVIHPTKRLRSAE